MIYAINKRTKEHRVYRQPMDSLFWAECELVTADKDGWIPWDGGECPLPDDQPVEVMRKDSMVVKRDAAHSVCWSDMGDSYTVRRYRPILTENTKPEAPEWDGEGEKPPVGSVCMRGYDRVKILAHTTVGSVCDPAVVYQSLTDSLQISWNVSNVFSPLRTPSQRAEDEVVEAMLKEFQYPKSAGVENTCRILYRAGYRKQEQQK